MKTIYSILVALGLILSVTSSTKASVCAYGTKDMIHLRLIATGGVSGERVHTEPTIKNLILKHYKYKEDVLGTPDYSEVAYVQVFISMDKSRVYIAVIGEGDCYLAGAADDLSTYELIANGV